MKHVERKALLEAFDPKLLGKTKEDQQFRFGLLTLLGDIADSQDSLAACYREMLEIQKSKTGGR